MPQTVTSISIDRFGGTAGTESQAIRGRLRRPAASERPVTLMNETFPITFVTLGGATVSITETEDEFSRTIHPAHCHGCGWDGPNFLPTSRRAANMHASECRSTPRAGGDRR